jgi:hypothetical protein
VVERIVGEWREERECRDVRRHCMNKERRAKVQANGDADKERGGARRERREWDGGKR